MMRAIRFATQLNFVIEDETFDSIAHNESRISIVSQERITEELNKIILAKYPWSDSICCLKPGCCTSSPDFVKLHGVDIVDGRGHKDNFHPHPSSRGQCLCPDR